MKILVTDGNTLPGLAITRSLGKSGHHVVVGHHRLASLAASSKYAKRTCVYPDPAMESGHFISYLLEYCQSNNIDAIFPVTDITTLLITKNSGRFEDTCEIPFPDYPTVSKAADKAYVLDLAKSIGVDIPKSIILNNLSELDFNHFALNYPVVVKPSRSRIMNSGNWISTSVTYANNEYELQTLLGNYKEYVYPILLQEKIVGSGLGIFLCLNKGKVIASFSHKRIREKPPSGGVSVFRESIALDPIAYNFSEKLLKMLNWHGVAMVEFKIDNRDSRPKLMEINGRFWGSLQLAIDSGVDFPNCLASLISPNTPDISSSSDYKTGVKTRWFWGDVDALLIRLFKPNLEQNLPKGFDSKLRYLLKFLILWEPGLRYEVFRMSDIKPFLFESVQWVARLFRRNA